MPHLGTLILSFTPNGKGLTVWFRNPHHPISISGLPDHNSVINIIGLSSLDPNNHLISPLNLFVKRKLPYQLQQPYFNELPGWMSTNGVHGYTHSP